MAVKSRRRAPSGKQPLPGSASPLHLPWGDARALGVDTAPLEAAAKRLRAQVDAGKLPGFMSCVVKEGQLVHFSAHGFADLCARAPLKADTLFRLYSQTKPITVVGALLLIERGLLSLEDPVAKHVPSFAELVVSSKHGTSSKAPSRLVTIRDLLAHTSGVGFGPGFHYEPENSYERAYTDLVGRVDRGEIRSLAEWCDEVAKVPLRFQPGANWGYGYSSDILGRVVEVVSGSPLDEVLTREVLQPLGMVDTFFAVPTEKVARLSALYTREPWDGGARNVTFVTVDPGGSGLTENKARRVTAVFGDARRVVAPSASVFIRGRASQVVQGGGCVCNVAGGLVSTLRDYARFGMMILNEGQLDGVRLLQRDSVRLLMQDWLNEFTVERRTEPLWVWNTPGVGFSPLGQIGVEAEGACRRKVGSALHTVHWGGAGGSGYMLNWPHRMLVLTYTGCTFDTWTQKAVWRASFGAVNRGGAKVVSDWSPVQRAGAQATGTQQSAEPQTPVDPPGSKHARASDDATPSKRRRLSCKTGTPMCAAAAAAALSQPAAARRPSTPGSAPRKPPSPETAAGHRRSTPASQTRGSATKKPLSPDVAAGDRRSTPASQRRGSAMR